LGDENKYCIFFLLQTSRKHSPWFLLELEIFLQFSVVQFLAATNTESSQQTINSHCLFACSPSPYSLVGGPHRKPLRVLLRVDWLPWKRFYSAVATNARTDNTMSSVAATVTVAEGTCLSFPYLAMTASSRSTVPTFAVMSQYYILRQHKIMIGFWQQIPADTMNLVMT
jgi:hypothetical protein